MASTIILSDNGASSGSAGLKQTAGNDGVLILQTTTSGGTATNALYVDTSQNVGLGVTPSAWGSYSGVVQMTGGALAGYTGGAYLELIQNGYFTGSAYKYVNNGYASKYQQNSGQHQWWSAPTGTAGNTFTFTQVLVTSKGTTLALEGASTVAGTGISFPATQSASSDANTLDDYEEGTFSPIFSQTDGTTTGLTYSVQVGKYTKVGNLVCVQGYVRLSSKASLTGGVRFGGMPFANTSSTNAYAAPSIPAFLDTTGITVYGGLFGDFSPNATNMQLYYGNGAAGGTLTFANIQNTFGLEFNFTYLTAT